MSQRAAEAVADQGLVERIRRGDREAEAALVARYSRGLACVIRRSVPEQAEDLERQCFSVLLARLREGAPEETARPGHSLLRIARGLMMRARRDAVSRAAPMARSAGIDHDEIHDQHLIELYLVGRLDTARQLRFEDHLIGCERCIAEIELRGTVSEGVRESQPPAATGDPASVQRWRTLALVLGFLLALTGSLLAWSLYRLALQ